jgi:hypothetical protein
MIAWQECPACGGAFAVWDAAYSTDKPPNCPALTDRLFVNREGEHSIANGSHVDGTRCLDCGISVGETREKYRTNVVADPTRWRCADSLPPAPAGRG